MFSAFLSLAIGYSLRVFPWLSILCILALAFLWYFFRDPERVILRSNSRLLSPADGRVVEIASVKEDDFLKGEALKIGVFMSLFDVHVNRMPCSGRVEFLAHRNGRFFDARSPEASIRNECKLIGLVADGGKKFLVKQIAGLVARRIVCPLNIGDHLEQGQRFGMVKFGSRVELYIPKDQPVHIRVREGQKVKAGITVLAELI
ncbi:MAG: phosphatidylserine decarboxylase family protein [Candidatus Brocadiales bacterium]|nr:phosphatidylserine decarboxylase family protein [Candidatus Brocadiales bacterium]